MSRRQICGCGRRCDLFACSPIVSLTHCVRSLFAYRLAGVVVFFGPSLSAYARFAFSCRLAWRGGGSMDAPFLSARLGGLSGDGGIVGGVPAGRRRGCDAIGMSLLFVSRIGWALRWRFCLVPPSRMGVPFVSFGLAFRVGVPLVVSCRRFVSCPVSAFRVGWCLRVGIVLSRRFCQLVFSCRLVSSLVAAVVSIRVSSRRACRVAFGCCGVVVRVAWRWAWRCFYLVLLAVSVCRLVPLFVPGCLGLSSRFVFFCFRFDWSRWIARWLFDAAGGSWERLVGVSSFLSCYSSRGGWFVCGVSSVVSRSSFSFSRIVVWRSRWRRAWGRSDCLSGRLALLWMGGEGIRAVFPGSCCSICRIRFAFMMRFGVDNEDEELGRDEGNGKGRITGRG